MLEESIFKISSQLSTISRNQKYFRTRENRNFSTVRSTERRIFNLSIVEGVMMVTMAALQVFIVRFFFQGARKGGLFLSSLSSSLPRPFVILLFYGSTKAACCRSSHLSGSSSGYPTSGWHGRIIILIIIVLFRRYLTVLTHLVASRLRVNRPLHASNNNLHTSFRSRTLRFSLLPR